MVRLIQGKERPTAMPDVAETSPDSDPVDMQLTAQATALSLSGVAGQTPSLRPLRHRRLLLTWLMPLALPLLMVEAGCSQPSGDDDSPEVSATPVVTPTPVPVTPTQVPVTPTQEPIRTPVPTPPPTPTPEPTGTPIPPTGSLSQSVEVRFDSTGAPHIYAKNEQDLFFAQGYLAARDRLFQLDLTRRQALGGLAELYGSGRLVDDMIARSFKPIEHAEAELATWQTERPREVQWANAYAAGVNAYIDDAKVNRNGATLPEACKTLGYVPEYLNSTQMLAMDYLFALTLGPSPLLELQITVISLIVGEDVMADLFRPAPIENGFTVPDAETPLDQTLMSVPPAPPFTYKNWMKGDPELRAHLQKVLAEPGARDKLRKALQNIQNLEHFKFFEGSNNWVVSGEHTASGAPLLANDTHMGFNLPNLWHQIHLNTTEAGGSIQAMGVAAAGAPAFLLGHTDKIGWGVTNNMVDIADLYLEVPVTVNGQEAVRFNNKNVLIETWNETFKVRQSDGTVTSEVRVLKRTPQHGVLLPSEELGLPESFLVSLKWVGEQPGSTIGTVYKFLEGNDIADVETAMEQHAIGAGNWVFATVDGDIAYDGRVHLPMRALDPSNPPWLAMPGTGGYEWADEYIPTEQGPHTYNPVSGIAASANNDPNGGTGDNDPLNERFYLGSTYDSGMRDRRIYDWLRAKASSGQKMTWLDMQTLQGDDKSLLAMRVIPFLKEAASRRPDLMTSDMSMAMAYLDDWDYMLTADSVGGSLYMAWWPTAIQEIFEDDLDESLFSSFTGDVGMYYARPFVYFLEATAANIDAIDNGTAAFPSSSGLNFFDDSDTAGKVETRDEDLLKAFARAVTYLQGKLGADMSQWHWERLHQWSISDQTQPWLGTPNQGPYGVDGYGFAVDCSDGTLFSNNDLPSNFSVGKIPTIKMIMDFSDGEVHAYNTIPGGQSEDPASVHYNDQTLTWISDTSPPLPFTREEVVAETEERWTLPQGFPEVARVVEE